jgi:hypothetical protein
VSKDVETVITIVEDLLQTDRIDIVERIFEDWELNPKTMSATFALLDTTQGLALKGRRRLVKRFRRWLVQEGLKDLTRRLS